MSTVLYELDSNTIKPDTTEWYSLLYNEDVINSNDGSENDKNDIVMEDHEIEYIKAVEKKVMEEYVKGLNKDDIVDKKDEQRPGFFARLFG
jgi:tRNA pseudouridine-54 N-methylase